MFDLLKLFHSLDIALFKGKMTESQEDGHTILLAEAHKRHWTDLRWLAYLLATVYHETARTMQPIDEFGKGRTQPYGVKDPKTGQIYYGRGYVQLTWKANYERFEKRLNVELVSHPELAKIPVIAASIAFEGMEHGLFTGVGLPKYFDHDTTDWINARKIINGLDRAELIAVYAQQYYRILKAHNHNA
jgi:putative chitinase